MIPSDKWTEVCVFVFQGSFLWGGPGCGEKDPEVGGYQVHSQEGIRGQSKQHWEWDSSPTQVSGFLAWALMFINDSRFISCMLDVQYVVPFYIFV